MKSRRNPTAKSLRSPHLRQRVVPDKKKPRIRGGNWYDIFTKKQLAEKLVKYWDSDPKMKGKIAHD